MESGAVVLTRHPYRSVPVLPQQLDSPGTLPTTGIGARGPNQIKYAPLSRHTGVFRSIFDFTARADHGAKEVGDSRTEFELQGSMVNLSPSNFVRVASDVQDKQND